MILIDESGNIIENTSNINNLSFIEFDLNKKYQKVNPAIKIDFKNDIKYNIKSIKKLINMQNKGNIFSSKFEDKKIKYIITNENEDIKNAFKAMQIIDDKEKYTFIYDKIFNSLDLLWKKYNPCKFCNNVCISSKNRKKSHSKENGCCYSFNYSKNPLKFIDNVNVCKYLGDNKECKTQNLSCKFFVCNYLKKNKLFNIDMKDYLLLESFFNNKQKLILKYNYFKSKEEIINKLLEDDKLPYFIYYLNSYYRI